MTVILSAQETRNIIAREFPDAVVDISGQAVVLNSQWLFKVADYLKKSPGLAFDYLNYITTTDYYDYFELVYQVTSLEHNHSLLFKVRCSDRTRPSLLSIVDVWRGADYQEREIYDLFGINFEWHPNLKRIVLWEGFQGYPLRKDYL